MLWAGVKVLWDVTGVIHKLYAGDFYREKKAHLKQTLSLQVWSFASCKGHRVNEKTHCWWWKWSARTVLKGKVDYFSHVMSREQANCKLLYTTDVKADSKYYKISSHLRGAILNQCLLICKTGLWKSFCIQGILNVTNSVLDCIVLTFLPNLWVSLKFLEYKR